MWFDGSCMVMGHDHEFIMGRINSKYWLAGEEWRKLVKTVKTTAAKTRRRIQFFRPSATIATIMLSTIKFDSLLHYQLECSQQLAIQEFDEWIWSAFWSINFGASIVSRSKYWTFEYTNSAHKIICTLLNTFLDLQYHESIIYVLR